MAVGPIPSTSPQSFLQILGTCDNFRLNLKDPLAERLVTLSLTPDPGSPAIGLLRPPVVEQLLREIEANGEGAPWEYRDHNGRKVISFASHVKAAAARSRVMKELCERWRDTGLWPDVVGPRKWRGEMYPIYRDPFGRHDAPSEAEEFGMSASAGQLEQDGRNYVFMMERAACALFGVVTYGVHMTVYEEDRDGLGLPTACRMWVPTRSKAKQTWPGWLDNSVAGGIPSGLSAFESLVKESMEEASIEEAIVRKHARSVGSVSYSFKSPLGWLQPEVEYVYDLRVPSGVDPAPFRPKPLDGEVESFELLPLEEVVTRMREGLFKPNTALVIIDFMIRHGYMTVENEPDYQEIVTRLHGRFEYDQW
ncbi:hypothetical protein DAEQUDRAFT_733767 [Daedalea quercina L-15889]|uniref:Nudix hydrolase domain-containing protein n=1 Tax=Daedalea quercina L-15889 TaxID=1314783 RepID=A0A165KQY2_9APHY|nr:hypothetical protein DAEQUDRAFT_733767 [Daedalea quercina L-15889]